MDNNNSVLIVMLAFFLLLGFIIYVSAPKTCNNLKEDYVPYIPYSPYYPYNIPPALVSFNERTGYYEVPYYLL